MEKRIPLLRGETTLESALASEDDMRLELAYPRHQKDLYAYLDSHRSDIEAVVSYHLGLKGFVTCQLAEVDEWICGNFNICMPVYIQDGAGWPRKLALIRVPLWYKLGESRHHGNIEEKLRCEAATFIWIKQHCPEIPMPRLWGFGFPGGQAFTTLEAVPYQTQLLWQLPCTVRARSGHPIPCRYAIHKREDELKIGYLIMDYVDDLDGNPLSKAWTDLPQDKGRRANFFTYLSRFMLSLAKCSFSRIGSMTIDEQGVLVLGNRPLTSQLHKLENSGVQLDISRSTTYSNVESYILDLLSCHDSRIRHQANSIRDHSDGEMKLSVLTAMRALLPHFASRNLRNGPFVFTLTDIHPDNIFVDGEWRITSVIGLDWACVRPIEMSHPPACFTGLRVDRLSDDNQYDLNHDLLKEFFDAFTQEEASFAQRHGRTLLNERVLREAYALGGFWYFHALDNPKAMCNVFLQHINPLFWGSSADGVLIRSAENFSLSTFRTYLAPFWDRRTRDLIDKKLRDKEEYERQLREKFERPSG